MSVWFIDGKEYEKSIGFSNESNVHITTKEPQLLTKNAEYVDCKIVTIAFEIYRGDKFREYYYGKLYEDHGLVIFQAIIPHSYSDEDIVELCNKTYFDHWGESWLENKKYIIKTLVSHIQSCEIGCTMMSYNY